MTIEKTYLRLSPIGDKTEVTPKTSAEVEYYRSFEDRGFTYTPVVVIHRSLEACESCSA